MVVLRAFAACAGLILAGFHVWLLGQQAWTGQLDYIAALRWLMAFGLVATLAALLRRGVSLRSRHTTALWVLALVLHGPALAGDRNPTAQLLAETSDVAIQIAGAALGLGLALTIGRIARAWRPIIDTGAAPAWLVRPARSLHAAFGDGFLPRPPPLA